MKAFLRYCAALLLAVTMVSCEKASWGELVFSPKSIMLDGEGGEATLLVGSSMEGADMGTISFSDIWIDRSSGTRYFNDTPEGSVIREVVNDWITVKVIDRSQYQIIADANDSGRSRKCHLSFRVGEEYVSYTVRQAK